MTALSAAPEAGNYVMAEELVLDEGRRRQGDTSQPGFGLSLIDLTQEIAQQLQDNEHRFTSLAFGSHGCREGLASNDLERPEASVMLRFDVRHSRFTVNRLFWSVTFIDGFQCTPSAEPS